jgi:hypothetical protein
MLLAAALTLAAASVAAAHTGTPRVDQRQANQRARIAQGVASGQLTRGEVARLRAGQAHVRRVERRAKSDGHVTFAERARLERAQDVQSGRIARLKHNRRAR